HWTRGLWVPPAPDYKRESSDKADLEGFNAALAFLHSGDTLRLFHANCSQRFEVWDMGRATSPPEALRASLRGATDTLAHATNFLNMIFQTNDIRESSVKEDVEWYQALVRSVIEGDAQIHRAVLTFDAHPMSSKPQLMLQATKKKDEILLQDLSGSTEGLRNLSRENEWFNALKSQQALFLHKRVLNNDLQSLDTPKWNRGDSYMMDTSHVRWSPPFLECEDGKFLPTWMVTLSSSFYGLKPDLSPEFKGVVRMDIKLQNVDINQCARGTGWFSDTHRCDLNSTQCVPQENRGFVLGRYLCLCKPGFYGASSIASDFETHKSSSQYGEVSPGNLLECRPCQEGCVTCVDDTPCLIQEDWSLRAAVLSCQAFCMLAVFLSMLISYHFRKSKRIRASGVILLETILFGSLLLYFPVFILYFKPSIFRCIVLRWVRMLGFAIVYGTITLKLYRVLKVFLSRTAQRVPYMTSGRVLKMLGLILLLVLWFLAAWTVGMLENIDKNIPLVIRSQTPRGLQFYICDHDRWDYMMVVAEMLFLLWGSFLCYATRTVPSAFHEPRYMGIALHNELIISTAFHVIRFVMVPSLHPDWTLLLFFIHTHVTITMTLALLFIPKFLHAGSPLREEIAAEVYEDELDMRRSGSYLNSSITSAWSEHSLDPDDIREELKKLYTQLEVHKTKKMTANNPHLQKKRSSKKGLGRSFMRRITELPESMSRKEEKDGSLTGGSRSRSGSYKRRLLDSGSSSMKMKDDPSKRKPVSLRKSHSTYDHVQDPKDSSPPRRESTCKDPSLLDSLMRKNLAKKASERSNSDSPDSAPLVYKSASAHNLSADKRPLHPKPSPLQKSLSVITSAKEKALLLPSRAYLEDSYQQTREEKKIEEGASTPEMHTLLQDSFDKSISVDSSHLSGRIHPPSKRTPPEPPIRYQSLSHSLEKSAVAPWNIQEQKQSPTDAGGKDAKEAPEFLNTWEVEKLPRKAEIADKGRSEQREGSAQMSSTTGKNKLTTLSSVAAEISPWEAEACNQDQHDKPTEPGDSKKPSTSSAAPPNLKLLCRKNSFKSLGLAIKALNRPKANSSIKGKKEGEGTIRETAKQNDRAKGPDESQQKMVIRQATICPWEEQETIPNQQNNNSSKGFETCPLQVSKGKPEGPQDESDRSVMQKATTGLGKTMEKGSSQESIYPQETLDLDKPSLKPGTRSQDLSEASSKKTDRLESKKIEVCPWETKEIETCIQAEIGSWEMTEASPDPGKSRQDKGEVSKENKSTPLPAAATGSSTRLETGSSQREVVCPWESLDTEELCTKLKAQSPGLSKPASKKSESVESKRAEVCPWEMEEDNISIRKTNCPWEGRESPTGKGKLGKNTGEDTKGDHRDTLKRPSPREKKLQLMSQQEAICPWESIDMEALSATPQTQSSALSKAGSRKSESLETKRAEVCPWEVEEADSKARAEICPWEESETPSEKGVTKPDKEKPFKGKKSITPEARGPSKIMEKGSSQREVICPWESLDMEALSAKPDAQSPGLHKVGSRKSESIESKRAEICPWEMEEMDSRVRSEICPWEGSETPSDKKKLKQQIGRASKGEKKGSRGSEDTTLKKKNGSSPQDSTSSWGSLDMEVSIINPNIKRQRQFKIPSKKSESAESRKAEICPWEMEGANTSIKAEICPWEMDESPSVERERKQDTGGAFKEDKSITTQAALASSSTALEKLSNQREAICPWESTDMNEFSVKPGSRNSFLSKDISKKSESLESKRAEVCPWESVELESSIQAEICPWEASEAPSHKAKLKKDKDGTSKTSKDISPKTSRAKEIGGSILKKPEKGSSEQEAICPWESPDMEKLSTKLKAQSPGLSKAASKTSESAESKRAEVCPWETEEVDTSIGKTNYALKRPDSRKTGETTSKKLQLMSQQEAICPWESTDLEALSTYPWAQSPALSKAGSRKSESLESKRAEVCPWEVEEADSKVRTEICPWEESKVPPEKGVTKPDKERSSNGGKSITNVTGPSKTMEKGSSQQEVICPWESLDMEESSVQPSPKNRDPTKGSTKKSVSVDSNRAEVCPWETEEAESSIKSKICLQEVTGASSDQGQSREDTDRVSKKNNTPGLRKTGDITYKSLEKKTLQESICPWESLDMDNSSIKAVPGAIISKRSDNAESKRSDICPWEAVEPGAVGKKSIKEEVCPWDVADASSVQMEKQAVEAASATGPKTSAVQLSKPTSRQGQAAHQPLHRILPDSQSLRALSRGSNAMVDVLPWQGAPVMAKHLSKGSTVVADVCPWILEGALTDHTETSQNLKACPWEAEDISPIHAMHTKNKSAEKMREEAKGLSQSKTDTCPWDYK
uniref:G protein-coupled receptor 179 n=1 Tax=Crocodylus porosus TaxID=8502 RepID=A0A7M4E1P3_CROPO